jgi:AcrR family transcriptional regulator
MLRTTSYRDLKVVDIAREAGTSPATFYQYFPDVESAILVLADEMVASGVDRFADAVLTNPWRGKAGYEAGRGAGRRHARLLGRAPAGASGDRPRHRRGRRSLRQRAHPPAQRPQQRAVVGGPRAPALRQGAARGSTPTPSLASSWRCSAHVSAHRLGFEFWGVRRDDLRATMARIVFWSITGQKPPG